MNTTITTSAAARYLAPAALFALLLGTTACGTATTPATDLGGQPAAPARIYPPTYIPEISPEAPGQISADAAERRAAAATAAAAELQTRQHEHKLGHPNLP